MCPEKTTHLQLIKRDKQITVEDTDSRGQQQENLGK